MYLHRVKICSSALTCLGHVAEKYVTEGRTLIPSTLYILIIRVSKWRGGTCRTVGSKVLAKFSRWRLRRCVSLVGVCIFCMCNLVVVHTFFICMFIYLFFFFFQIEISYFGCNFILATVRSVLGSARPLSWVASKELSEFIKSICPTI